MLQKNDVLKKKIKTEMVKLGAFDQLLKGNIYHVNKLSRGVKYDAHQLTYKGINNITKTIYIKKEKLKDVENAISNYKKAKEIIDKVVDLTVELIKLSNE